MTFLMQTYEFSHAGKTLSSLDN